MYLNKDKAGELHEIPSATLSKLLFYARASFSYRYGSKLPAHVTFNDSWEAGKWKISKVKT